MLVLTRKKGQSIRIGDFIEIIILSVDHDGVKVGIVAPKTLPVHRQEVYELIQTSNQEASIIQQTDLQTMKEQFLNEKSNHENKKTD